MYARYIPSAGGQKSTSNNREPLPVAKQSPAPPTASSGDGLSYSRYIPGVTPQKQSETPTVQRFEDESDSAKSKRKRDDGEQLQEPQDKKRKEKGSEAVPELPESAEQEKKAKRSKESEPNGAGVKESKKDKKEKKKAKKEKRQKDASDEADNGSTSEDQNPKQTSDTSNAHLEDSEMVDAEPATTDGITPAPQEQQPKKPKKEKKKKSQNVPTDEAEGAEEEEEEDTRHKAVFERLGKSLKYAEILKEQGIDEEPQEPTELHGLEPLPQPARTAPSAAKPTYEILPPWLSAPIRVSVDTRTPFTELGILPKAARVLEQKGYTEAFAVQTAALPLLLPSNKQQQPGDLLVSAATGSGKTLAYALPIVRDVSNSVVTRLRALVVLPTRELVKQAQEVFELCAKAYEGEDRKRVRVGIAIGNQSLASEQDLLVGRETRYDPEAYKQLEQEASSSSSSSPSSQDDLDALLLLSGPDRRANPRLGPWQGQVIDFYSKVDVLICTPGRLVEHLDQTPGFTLSHVRWLVVDEADKLLAQSFQGWLDVVLDKFKTTTSHHSSSSSNVLGARDFPDMPYSGVRKILLSATLTRDLSLLNQLALWRPRLIVLESSGQDAHVAEHSLPEELREYAVRVHDANLKPLYLLDLLRSQHMATTSGDDGEAAKNEHLATKAQSDPSSDTSSDDSSSESDSSSDSDSDSDATSSDSDSDSDTSSSSSSSSRSTRSKTKTQSRIPSKHSPIPRSLIFTKSNESALRLSRLLALLDPSLATQIGTLTSTTPTSVRRKTLRAFTTPSSPLRLIIASDLVARGIDIPKLPHVINYDLPPSVAGYVHRVGRTARAGRQGCAWTLVGDGESGWFWGKIGKSAAVKRAQKVGRVMIEEMSEERIEEYEAALEKLGKEALESRKK
ncbi:P-loop containing nucleoside triphosphate hydrolase protein [Trichoderma reesei RUT C-30]|uniref:ATP-dependent RNA helicase n=1 Tax=Hypocrea jecorina (strain ATCC 56765 / BCRC 32924 / NRRL 11460 / Rut C-30) TaxID=1344414 RepID=A0A024SD07_HYPJR|nr:P-loop containing nucleoside triphosphate hydrolase protein [Trichoderma reesei RUT C-30]